MMDFGKDFDLVLDYWDEWEVGEMWGHVQIHHELLDI